MSEVLAADYATARPSPASMHSVGLVGVLRYLSPGSNPKNLTAAEAALVHAADLGIGTIWESTGDRALGGGSAGHADGLTAVSEANWVGQPHGTPLLCNIGDFVATAAQIPVIHDYYHEFRAVAMAFQVGGYGTGFIIDALVARGAVGLWWQNAMNDAGVPGNVVSPHASLYQRTVHTVHIPGTPDGDWDENVVIPSAMRVNWWVKAAPPSPPPVKMLGVVLYDITSSGVSSRPVVSEDDGKTWV